MTDADVCVSLRAHCFFGLATAAEMNISKMWAAFDSAQISFSALHSLPAIFIKQLDGFDQFFFVPRFQIFLTH
jgi:hypothetical protein